MIKYYLAYLRFAYQTAKVSLINYFTGQDERKKICNQAFEKLGLDIEVKGSEHADTQMYLINHQSMVDIFLLESVSNRNLSWIAKEELKKVPFLGYMLKSFQMILLKRENKAGLRKLVKDVDNRTQEGRVVCIFPEGTRVKRQKLGKFKSGAKFIVSKLDLNIQPVVVVGSHYMLDSIEKKHRKVAPKVIFLPPVDKSVKGWYEQMQADMQEVIDYEYSHNHCRR